MNRFHQTEQNTGQPYFPISLFMVFFQTRRAGEECLEQGSLSVLIRYRHRAVAVWSGSSCELFLLENLIRPMEEKTEPELKPGLSTFSSVVLQEQGRSVCGLGVWPVRGQGPGASQPLPYVPDFHSLEQLQSPRCPGSHPQSSICPFFPYRSFLLQTMVL